MERMTDKAEWPPAFPECVPVLTDSVVTLRAHRAEDIPRIVVASQEEGMRRWTIVPRPYDESSARDFLQLISADWDASAAGVPEAAWRWAVTRAEEPDRYLGTVDMRPTGRGAAELAFGLHPDARGAGIAARATRLIMEYAEGRGVTTVRWRAYTGNWDSRRVAWACGFTFEGTLAASLPRPSLSVALVPDGPVPDGSAEGAAPGAAPGEAVAAPAATWWDEDSWEASWGAGEPMAPQLPWYDPPELDLPAGQGAPAEERSRTSSGARLRAWREDDGPRLPTDRDPESWHRMGAAIPTGGVFDEDLAWWREEMSLGRRIAWCVADAETDAPLGGIWRFGIDVARRPGSAELGAFIVPGARGRGLMARAASVVLDYAFVPVADGGMGLVRVRALADVDNHSSVRSLLRAGMSLTGWTRGDRPERRPDRAGDHVDMLQLEVLASDDRAAIGATHAAAAVDPVALLVARAQALRSR